MRGEQSRDDTGPVQLVPTFREVKEKQIGDKEVVKYKPFMMSERRVQAEQIFMMNPGM